MSSDDIIYILFLSFHLIFGYYYKKIKNRERKKWIGSFLGIATLAIVLRIHIFYSFLMFLTNSVIILWLPKSYCHLVSFTYTFTQLIYTRIDTAYLGTPFLPYQTTVVEMVMTLKLVGLAFDINYGYMLKKQKTIQEDADAELERSYINPTLIDIFHYTFNFMGILTGPYYRYKTLADFFELPFAAHAHWYERVLGNIFYIIIYTSLYIIADNIWPISYAISEEFYNSHSWLYRLWYSCLTFLTFRLHLYAGLLFTESTYIMSGLGAYPNITEPKPGHGPTKCFQEMKEIAVKSAEDLAHERFNFETVHNIDPYKTEFSTTAREAMKNWNMCIQYWLATTIYKRFPYKQLRTWATMFVSALWHGMYTGYYICIGFMPFYLPVEDTYVNLFLKHNKGKSFRIWEYIIWLSRMLSFSYLSVAFHLLDVDKCILYYKSTYFSVFIFWGILYIVGQVILKRRRKISKTDQNHK